LLECTPSEAVKFLTGVQGEVDEGKLEFARRRHRRKKIDPRLKGGVPDDAEERKGVLGLSAIRMDIENRYVSERLYQFFTHPPGKAPTNIRRETVDRYHIFERTWGTYANRAVIPFYFKGELIGYCAVDLLGKEEWLRQHPSRGEDDYKKTLYAKGLLSGQYLFGIDDCEKGADVLVLVEGPREVMKLWQEGFTNAVAILGAYLSDKHFELITELSPKRIALMFDGDAAGRAITTRAAERPKNLQRVDFERLTMV
jgi:hypothetical protein